eukprot:TRINITY_DN1851_c5_g1_i1.p1 TRINITY_DN1851_c5_g1~~TRINITY_DN1851_c5_g1_i1.p1  ORF type:complete len:531 (+),score=193.46 TRINITY_DN1851_c5_g1_i1:101-1693(+)
MEDTCLLCCDEAESFSGCWAVYACGHTSCFKCALRLRLQSREDDGREWCPYCKADSTKLLITENADAQPSDYEHGVKLPASLGSVRASSRSVADIVQYLTGCYCPFQDCGKHWHEFRSSWELSKHVSDVHGLYYCKECLKSKPAFVGEQLLYTRAELRQHRSTDMDCEHDNPQFCGHPKCYFCDQYAYDTEELHKHMQKSHISCSFCEQKGALMVYHRDMDALKIHCSTDHWFCTICEEAYGAMSDRVHEEWTFSDQLDFDLHQQRRHGVKQKVVGGLFSGRTPARPAAAAAAAAAAADDGVSVITFVFPEGGSRTVPMDMAARRRQRREERERREQRHSPAAAAAFSEEDGAVMQSILAMLGSGDARYSKYNMLRLKAKQFVAGEQSPGDFYDLLDRLLGRENLRSVFSDLAADIPDAGKREALRLMHNVRNTTEHGVADPKPEPAAEKKPKGKKKGKKDEPAPSPPSPPPSKSSPPSWSLAAGSSGMQPTAADFPALQPQTKGRGRGRAKPAAAPAASGVWAQRAKKL